MKQKVVFVFLAVTVLFLGNLVLSDNLSGMPASSCYCMPSESEMASLCGNYIPIGFYIDSNYCWYEACITSVKIDCQGPVDDEFYTYHGNFSIPCHGSCRLDI